MSAFDFFLSFCGLLLGLSVAGIGRPPGVRPSRWLAIAAIILVIGHYALQLVSDTVSLIATLSI